MVFGELEPKQAWTRFGFPTNYNSDILEAMLALASVGAPMSAALEKPLQVIRDKRTAEGVWLLEKSLNGQMWVDVEVKGQPSKWLTLFAMMVLDHFARCKRRKMNIRVIIKSQYRAALAILGEAIEKCPDVLWDEADTTQQVWHIAYHALYFTHLYLQVDGEDFVPWDKHREPYQFFESLPWAPDEPLTDRRTVYQGRIARVSCDLSGRSRRESGRRGFGWRNPVFPGCR